MKIMITGGYDEATADADEGKTIIEFARSLASQIIIQNHELRCGNVSSLDAVIIEAACDAADEKGLDADSRVVSYHKKGQEPRTPRGGVNGSALEQWSSMDGRKPTVPEPIEQANVLILVGGFGDDSGTYTAANWARQSGTPILPVATFGMATRDIFDDLPSSVERSKITGLTNDELNDLTRSPAVLTDAAKIQEYAVHVVGLAEKAALSRDVFIIMSFDEAEPLKDYVAAVTEVCKEAGFDAVRSDTRPATSTHQIIDTIHDSIQSCGFVIANLTQGRPNVYYEIGFAMGLGKKLVLTSRENDKIEFDLQGFNRVEYKGMENLKEQLRPIVGEISSSFGLSAKGAERS